MTTHLVNCICLIFVFKDMLLIDTWCPTYNLSPEAIR